MGGSFGFKKSISPIDKGKMAKGGVTIKLGPGFGKFHAYSLAFRGKFAVASKQAIRQSTLLGQQLIIQRIRAKEYTPNAGTTLLIKKSLGFGDIPLVKTGRIIRAIATETLNPFEGVVGLLANRRASGGKGVKMSNIGELLHDGGTIRVTPAMARAAARAFAAANPGKARTRVTPKGIIRIPPRPFVERVFESIQFRFGVRKIYARLLKIQLEL